MPTTCKQATYLTPSPSPPPALALAKSFHFLATF